VHSRSAVRLLVGASLAVASTIGSLTLAQSADAATYASCSSMSGLDLSGQAITVSGCTGPTGGSGVIPGALASPATVSWAGGGTTSISFKTKVHKKSKCAPGSSEMQLSGHATASTGPAQSIQGMFYATVCVGPNEQLSLLPGKQLLLQIK
jgi:hypothetical protein